MATAAEGARSIGLGERIATLDLLRGVAICGILLMNIPGMGMLWHVGHPPFPARPTLDWTAYGIQSVLFEGSMRGLFTLLFGAGMLVMLRRAEQDGAAAPIDVFIRRCLALMLLGVVQFAVFMWPGEILFDYGMTGFFILAFRRARPRTLLTVALVLLALFSLASIGQAYDIRGQVDRGTRAEQLAKAGRPLTREQQKALDAFREMRERRDPPPAAVAREIARRTSFPGVLAWSAGEWSQFNLDWESWFGRLESFIFMLVGMALFRTGVLSGERRPGFYLRLALGCYAVALPLRLALTLARMRMGTGFDFWTVLVSGVGYEPLRLLMTLGHVGLLCRLWQAGALGAARPARALGRMALTTYSLQSIITAVLFYGLGLLDRLGFAALMGVAALIWLATGLFATLWLRTHAMGPAEAVLRRIAYGRGERRGPAAVPGPDGSLATA